MENEENKSIALHPGDCFGWYSHVSSDCHASSCLRSEICKSYTLNRANHSDKSIKKNLDEIGKDSSERIKEKTNHKDTQKNMADLGKQAYFDQIVIAVGSYMKHDRVNYSPKRDAASLKIGGKVIAFLLKKRYEIIFELGGRNKGGPICTVNMGENIETSKSEIKKFIEENT
jgi:hypothetical protein